MKKLMVLLVALSSFVVMVHAEDIVVSWSSNGVVMAEGMVPGSTCTVEWVTTMDQTFTNATENIVFNDREDKTKTNISTYRNAGK
jgi:hypothetical protein